MVRQRARSAPRTELDWLSARFDALYQSDGSGRLVARRSAGDRRPPRFVFGRTRLGCIWRFAADEPDAAVRALARYAALEGPVSGLVDGRPAAPERLEPMRRALEAVTPIVRVWNGPAFRFPVEHPGHRAALESLARGGVVVVDPSDERVAECAAVLELDVEVLRGQLPLAISAHDGGIVSVCRCVRGEAAGFVHARVDTRASARGHGHAPRVTAAWALAVVGRGGSPLFATEWTNRASLGVARKLALVAFVEGWSFT